MTRRSVVGLCALVSLFALPGCGGGGGSTQPTVVPTPAPTPAATLTAKGEGSLVLHPSADSRFFYALETPVRLTETTGGNADWNYARIQFFRRGSEIERNEIGADTIRAAGYSRVAARSNNVYTIYFRNNHEDFDDAAITLGFGDIKDGRQFTVDVPFNTFSDVTISITPKSVPTTGTVKLGR